MTLNGTARFVGMGGAMGALGGDISVISSNPAGIGIFRSNDVSISFGFNNTSTKSNFSGVSMNENKTRVLFDQIGFVYSNKIGNNTSLRFVNFGFNYHKSKNFNRLFSMGGALDNLSQSFQLAQEMERYGLTESEFNDIMDVKNPYTKYWNQLPVLGVMGVRTVWLTGLMILKRIFMLHGGGMVLTITSLVRKQEVSVNMILMFHSILKIGSI